MPHTKAPRGEGRGQQGLGPNEPHGSRDTALPKQEVENLENPVFFDPPQIDPGPAGARAPKINLPVDSTLHIP